MKNYVIYSRVSTKKQGDHGVSLDAQAELCRNFVASQKGNLIGEFHDVESGASRTRAGLIQALAMAKVNDATIVFAKLDRMARDAEYAFTIKNSGVPLVFLDQPEINSLVFGILVTWAEEERKSGSSRTKVTMKFLQEQIRKHGGFTTKDGRWCTKLGNPDPVYAMECAREVAAEKKMLDRVNNDQWMMARKYAERLRASGMTLIQIIEEFDIIGIKKRTGTPWCKQDVSRLLKQRIK